MKKQYAWAGLFVVIVCLFLYARRSQQPLPSTGGDSVLSGNFWSTWPDFSSSSDRGIRNNNPLNIEYSAANNWLGQTGTDGRFCTFVSPDYGIRAGAKLLDRYINEYQLTTVIQIISKWAPDFENPTTEYAEYVAMRMGVNPYVETITSANIYQMVLAMIEFENGNNPYPESVIQSGMQMAMS